MSKPKRKAKPAPCPCDADTDDLSHPAVPKFKDEDERTAFRNRVLGELATIHHLGHLQPASKFPGIKQ